MFHSYNILLIILTLTNTPSTLLNRCINDWKLSSLQLLLLTSQTSMILTTTAKVCLTVEPIRNDSGQCLQILCLSSVLTGLIWSINDKVFDADWFWFVQYNSLWHLYYFNLPLYTFSPLHWECEFWLGRT